jgi:ankyrin repeat protein
VVSFLVGEAGAEKNAPDKDHITPLHWAAGNGFVEVVKFLVGDAGADKQARTALGMTPLHWAARMGHIDVVRPNKLRIGLPRPRIPRKKRRHTKR